jgi:hypothetical protein
VGVHKLAPEAGMFIKAKVNGVITNLLIDTGATVTLISTGFIKDMSNMPTLSPSQRDILTANGESLVNACCIVFRRVAVSSLFSCSVADLRYPPPSFLFNSALLKASSSTACLMASLRLMGGKPGHVARFCPRGDVTCYGCGVKGHVVRFCPKGRRQNQNGGRQKGRNNDDL